ncbi:MAG: hypothetical protein LH617_11625 [Ramlibacter sp.]|nr:hypothetical protein [Ramlibacter sp.]
MGWLTGVGVALVTLAAGVVAAAAYGSSRWTEGTRSLRAGLEAARLPPVTARYDAREIEALPAPVQRYFRGVLKDGQAIVSALSVEHTGTFNMSDKAQQWKPFTSTQRIITRRPGFDWDARIMMLPGAPVHIHDAYVAGVGTLRGAVFGLIPVVDIANTPELAQGELMRFLAEAAWYPTALLPSQGVRWEAIDDRSARATLSDETISVALTFNFHAAGPIDTVRSESRGRVVDGKTSAAPWQGRFWDHALRNGIRVPLHGEVAWILPEGVKPYWRGSITAIKYEFAD